MIFRMIAAAIEVLPTKFAMREDQPIQLDGDVWAEGATWVTLANDTNEAGDDLEQKEKDDTEEVIRFEKPQLARHLIPLYVRACIDGRPISRVLVDSGAIMNVIPFGILSNLGKTQKDLKETNMEMPNFTGKSTTCLWI